MKTFAIFLLFIAKLTEAACQYAGNFNFPFQKHAPISHHSFSQPETAEQVENNETYRRKSHGYVLIKTRCQNPPSTCFLIAIDKVQKLA